ncbi:DUF4197 domain-containing protein [Ferribacterium limneticum]|uniref:DUF4197 domain-containing protein n=1 Tax=Ferribacterium limneticum TaxID=76259 RepID=UPI001CFBC852|nr:DUF4197 domain-containing protein [Ferribacterium limneticum]UCV28203.1 DUF4197 domain-containing protein [Ferribacterium limneticum]UCV32120.1 DUF4197 domain-containing protein [Ferribacterium limneticum]
MRRLLKPVFALIFSLSAALAQAGALDAISSGDASAGVKEALAKGADYAVSSLGKNSGFLGNDKVKIPLPGYLQKAESALRMFGMGKQADQLVETMNHAAENAVAEAKPILVDSIKKMSVQDAKGILTGGDDSVTQYFKRTSTDQLTAKFMPIVKTETNKLQLADQYNKFAGKAASAGLVDKKDADIDSYVTQKAMDGLFLMIAEEEKKLRANPVGAGSDLLKKVFGAL